MFLCQTGAIESQSDGWLQTLPILNRERESLGKGHACVGDCFFRILVVVLVVVVFIVVVSHSAIGGLIIEGSTKVVVVVEFPTCINIPHGGDSTSPPKLTGIGGEGMDHQSSPSKSDEPSESPLRDSWV